MEGLDYWKWHTHVNTDFIRHTSTVATLSKTTINFAQVTLRVAMAVVWLIRTSPAQFNWSGRFNTPYFWYAPEDVNCAFEYLRNLRQQPQNREREGLYPHQLAWSVKQGVDAGLASLHNSVSEGEWAGRYSRNDIVTIQEEALEDQREKADDQHENPDEQGERPDLHTENAETQGDDMREQLFRLRMWSYNTLSFLKDPDESELDRLMNIARLHTRPQDRNMDVYRLALMDVAIFVWTKAHPSILRDLEKDMFSDFKLLLKWLHDRRIVPGDDDGVAALLEDTVKAIAADDRVTYSRKKSRVKEMVYRAEFE